MSTSKSNTPVPADHGDQSSRRQVEAFLDKVAAMPAPAAASRGRLVFAMDATMSRQPAWDRALAIQADMFAEAGRIGGLDVQLVYFRGFGQCQASRWVSQPERLARLMSSVECRGGNTQIGKVFSHIVREARKSGVSAVVYVGDCMEENIDKLCRKAGEIGLLGIPLFMFQEGHDSAAGRAFKEFSRLTGGAYCRFDGSSPGQLRDLLRAVAAFASGGTKALDALGGRNKAARLLLGQMKS